jgi:hypothetical protein
MIDIKLIESKGIVVVEPKDPLDEADFIDLTKLVDVYLKTNRKLNGIIIRAEEFPGWKSFGSFVKHIRFVRDHHRQIEKVALVTDSFIGKIVPFLSGHFVSAEIKNFPFEAIGDATEWIAEK